MGDPLLAWLTHKDAPDAGSWEVTSFLTRWALMELAEHPHDMAAGYPHSK